MRRFDSLSYAFAINVMAPGRRFRFDKGRRALYMLVGTLDEPRDDGTSRTLLVVSRLDPRKGQVYAVLSYREYRDTPVIVY